MTQMLVPGDISHALGLGFHVVVLMISRARLCCGAPTGCGRVVQESGCYTGTFVLKARAALQWTAAGYDEDLAAATTRDEVWNMRLFRG